LLAPWQNDNTLNNTPDACEANVTFYKNAKLYFLSGTGNTFRATTWMAERLQAAGVKTQMRAIGADALDSGYIPEPESLLGLAAPVHGFTAPWLMMRFVARLPRGRGSDAVVTAVHSGMSATSHFLIGLLLWLKGYRVRSFFDVVMPDNWTALISGPTPEEAQAVIAKAERKFAVDVDAFLDGKRTVPSLMTTLWAVLLLLVAVAYQLWGRFFLAKLFFASDKCIGCGQCAANCPWNAIKMKERDGQRRPYWTLQCGSCMRCMNYCPTQAIEAGHSWAVLLGIVTSLPVAWWAFRWLSQWILALSNVPLGVLLLVQYAFMFAATIIAYRVFDALLRVPAINRFFTRTTFTRRYRRYHEPDTELKDL